MKHSWEKRLWLNTVACSWIFFLNVAYTGATEAASAPTSQPGPLRVYFFDSSTCLECKATKKVLDTVEKRFGETILVKRFCVDKLEDFERMLAMEDQYGSQETAPPKVFFGRRHLVGRKVIEDRLEAVITEELAWLRTHRDESIVETDTLAATRPAEGEESGLLKRFSSFRFGAVSLAGLVDGVNPCAFTTIIFLLSMLNFLGKTTRQLIVVGVSFTAAVFLTYLGLGLGLFYAIKTFSVQEGLASGLTIFIAAIAILLGGWSLVDAIRAARSKNVPQGMLGLPSNIKKSIHAVIRKGLRTHYLAGGAFAVGVLVSLLESLCTGQVYLPTIMLVFRTTPLRLQAFGYLLLYNLMFIIPLVVVFLVTYWGVSSDRIGGLMKHHLGKVKFLMAILFIGLGILLLVTL